MEGIKPVATAVYNVTPLSWYLERQGTGTEDRWVAVGAGARDQLKAGGGGEGSCEAFMVVVMLSLCARKCKDLYEHKKVNFTLCQCSF